MTDIKKKVALVIGDTHDAPKINKERFYWIGRQIKDYQPDYIVQIGDWSNFDSLANFSATALPIPLLAPVIQIFF